MSWITYDKMINDSNKDVITTSDSNNILPAKLENVKWFKSNAWMIMPHFYIMVYFIEKTITLYIQLVLHCSKLILCIWMKIYMLYRIKIEANL